MARPATDSGAQAPLTPAVFSILMALADGEKHGYAITQRVAEDTDGSMRLGPGTLYGTLDRMLRAGLVAETERPTDDSPHHDRRRFYRSTDEGSRVLQAELLRLNRAVALARRRKLLPRTSSVTP